MRNIVTNRRIEQHDLDGQGHRNHEVYAMGQHFLAAGDASAPRVIRVGRRSNIAPATGGA